MVQKEDIFSIISKHDPTEVMIEGLKIFSYHYPQKEFVPIANVYHQIINLFKGRFKGYKACNTEYHDINHTLDAFLASLRIVDGYILAGNKFNMEILIKLLIATLLHDTGYIQEETDNDGTGAKYTKFHVMRSVEFLEKNYKTLKVNQNDISEISEIIKCTGVKVNWEEIHLSNELKVAGQILGTSDLIGQMADRNYLEKLLFLYYEFQEAQIPGFTTEFDILKNTLNFYKVTIERLDNELGGVYKFAQYHFKERYNIDKNVYMEAIEKHMNYLTKIIEDNTTNFRKKLKRGNIVEIVDRRKNKKSQ